MGNKRTAWNQRAREYWEAASADIDQRFGLSPAIDSPEFKFIIPEAAESPGPPTTVKGDVILINSNPQSMNTLLPVLVGRACLQSALPEEILCKECISDLSFEYARQRITDDEVRKTWTNIWSEFAPPIIVSTVLGYDPVEAYDWLYSMVGERGIDTIIKDLTYRAKNEIQLTFEEYLRYFASRLKRFSNLLDSTELKIIKHLTEDESITVTSLAKSTDLSTEWASKKLTDLKNRKVLRQFTRVPFSRVGIDMFHIILKRMFGTNDPFSLLRDCPFLYSYRQVLSGSWDAIGILCVPHNAKSLGYLEEGLRLLSKQGFNVEMQRVYSSGVVVSFDFYRECEGWNIPWELLSVQLGRIMADNLADVISRVDRTKVPTDLELSDLDMRIFSCIHEGITSVAKIRAQLGVGQERLAKRLKTLRQHHLITTSWEVHNIGLNEHVFVFEREEPLALAISSWTQRLPKSIVSFSEKGELSLQVDLPSGGSYGFCSALEEVSSQTQSAVLSPKIYGLWRFPRGLWDSRYQKWLCPEQKLEHWLDAIKGSNSNLETHR
jgi:DNA-binding Lrp family transcriptional regulator